MLVFGNKYNLCLPILQVELVTVILCKLMIINAMSKMQK